MAYPLSFEREFDNVNFYGTFEYIKGEKPTMEHPGSSTQVFLNEIMVKGSKVNLIDVIKLDIIEAIEEDIARDYDLD